MIITEEEGKIINSPILNGLTKNQAISKIIEYFKINKIGNKSVNYKLRDWVYHDNDIGAASAIYYEDGSYRVLDKDELPVILPYNISLEAKGNALLMMKNGERSSARKQKSHTEKPIR